MQNCPRQLAMCLYVRCGNKKIKKQQQKTISHTIRRDVDESVYLRKNGIPEKKSYKCHSKKKKKKESYTMYSFRLQSPSEIIVTTAKNGVVPDATSN